MTKYRIKKSFNESDGYWWYNPQKKVWCVWVGVNSFKYRSEKDAQNAIDIAASGVNDKIEYINYQPPAK